MRVRALPRGLLNAWHRQVAAIARVHARMRRRLEQTPSAAPSVPGLNTNPLMFNDASTVMVVPEGGGSRRSLASGIVPNGGGGAIMPAARLT